MALNTSVPLYKQLKATMPEVQAVNAMYTHGIGVIISTKVRYGGFGKGVAFRLLSYSTWYALFQGHYRCR